MAEPVKNRKNVVAHDDLPIRSHVDSDVTGECAYCGGRFAPEEIAIEREIHGRKWRFCSEEHYHDFLDALHFRDEDLDAYEPGHVTVGDEEE